MTHLVTSTSPTKCLALLPPVKDASFWWMSTGEPSCCFELLYFLLFVSYLLFYWSMPTGEPSCCLFLLYFLLFIQVPFFLSDFNRWTVFLFLFYFLFLIYLISCDLFLNFFPAESFFNGIISLKLLFPNPATGGFRRKP